MQAYIVASSMEHFGTTTLGYFWVTEASAMIFISLPVVDSALETSNFVPSLQQLCAAL